MQGITVALRYSSNITADIARGYSLAGWGINPYASEDECYAEWPHHTARYSEELGSWMPTLDGLCAVCAEWGEAFEEALEYALEAFESKAFALPFDSELYAFECESLGADEYGYEIVRPVKGGRVEHISRRA